MRYRPWFLVPLIVAVLAGCGGGRAAKGPITVATMVDSEGALLGKSMVLLLEAKGYTVVDRTGFGTPDVLRKALEAKEVDLVVDYTGSGQFYHGSSDPSLFSDPVRGYETTRKLDKERNDLVWLTPAKANNTEALAMLRSFAEANGIADMEDFAAWVNAGKPVKLICAVGFAENPLGLPGFEKAYGFALRKDQLILLESGNTAQMLKALVEGIDGVNVSLVYGTDGALDKMNVVVLRDPKSIPPVYLPAPVIRGEVLRKYPELEKLFTRLFESLELETLQRLNARIAFDGEDATDVARSYLRGLGLLKE
jgi:osmoprotectant transport system substrate-binding protein